MKPALLYHSPIGPLYLVEEHEKIYEISFSPPTFSVVYEDTPLLLKLRKELEEYFSGERKVFSVPYVLRGTPFQKKCYEVLATIPYGETISYQEEAAKLGDIHKARACGRANHDNFLPILVPCHRVIGKNKKLVGYAAGIDKKSYLLKLEKGQKERGFTS